MRPSSWTAWTKASIRSRWAACLRQLWVVAVTMAVGGATLTGGSVDVDCSAGVDSAAHPHVSARAPNASARRRRTVYSSNSTNAAPNVSGVRVLRELRGSHQTRNQLTSPASAAACELPKNAGPASSYEDAVQASIKTGRIIAPVPSCAVGKEKSAPRSPGRFGTTSPAAGRSTGRADRHQARHHRVERHNGSRQHASRVHPEAHPADHGREPGR